MPGKRNDVYLLQKGSSPVLCQNQNMGWVPNTCCSTVGKLGRGVFTVSLILTGPTSAETQPSSGSTGNLIYLLFLTLQIRDRTEQERPGILGTWQHY